MKYILKDSVDDLHMINFPELAGLSDAARSRVIAFDCLSGGQGTKATLPEVINAHYALCLQFLSKTVGRFPLLCCFVTLLFS